ncbi:MAG: peptidase M61, partial [Cyclobacteriaceae bacterium]
VKHPETLYGSSALLKQAISTTEDVFSAEDFNFLADGPIMYCAPDTVTKKIANAEVLVSVYSQNSVLTAAEIMDNIDDLMEAQSQYLGGELPVDRYAYLITLFDGPTLSGGYGALEHSYSSLYYFPERAGDRISQIIKDVAAHEFFHIVTPLNIHSKQIGEFDYINPKMSKHLWLYEGVTEYSAIHVQGQYGFFTTEEFLAEVGKKMSNKERFGPDISFTEMSENILDEEFEPLYGNVYQKGALIGMCLDISLLKYSNGEKDLQWLMRELAKKYGKSTSFEDDKLFEVITELTYPEIGEFLDTHVAGDEPLPFKEVLDWVGVNYSEPHTTQVISFGNVSLNVNEDGQIVIADISEMNRFGKDLGLQSGDILININGSDITMGNSAATIANFKNEAEAGDKVYYIVLREKKGKLKKKKLKAKTITVESMSGYTLELQDEMSDEQRALLNAWINLD